MKSVGVICECNPMHEGHRYLLRRARESGADAVVCVMSGCFTQRGEAAVLDPRARAEILVRGGADVVLEFPFPYSCGGAETFAEAGVSILARAGVDELWFGSECGDLSLLRRFAEVSDSEDFAQRYREACRGERIGTADAFGRILAELSGGAEPGPNDRLAIAYLKALSRWHMEAVTVKRVGSGFAETALSSECYPSATALRRALTERGAEALRPYVAEEAYRILCDRVEQKTAPASVEQMERAVLAYLRLTPPERLESVPELGGGLGRRLASMARGATSYGELLAATVTKKYTEARIRRGILFALAGVEERDLNVPAAYATLLAANRTGCAFLKLHRRDDTFPVVAAHRGIPETADAARQEELTRRAWGLYTLCMPSARTEEHFLRNSALILSDI